MADPKLELDPETEMLMKSFLYGSMRGWLIGAQRMLKEGVVLCQGPEGYQIMMVILLRGGIPDYFNKCYHNYFQKKDEYIVETINKFKKKEPTCLLNLQFAMSVTWIKSALENNTILELCGRDFLTLDREPALAKIDAWLEKHYGVIEPAVKAASYPCGKCPTHTYIPGEIVFRTSAPPK